NRGYEDGDFEIDEVIVESLSLQGRKIAGTPFGLTVGRQHLFYGEGLVCWDGGPLDGSRTAYFNAAVAHIEWGKRRFDLHAISNPEKDDYLPVVNGQDRSLIEWDERGGGLYYTDESFAGRKIEAYYFYKNENDPDDAFPESDIHTLGARVSGDVTGDLSFAAEWAGQIGDRGGAERLGYGGYLRGTYRAPLERPLDISAGGIYLSGDDPATGDYEGWNTVYARWPKWSELYIYTLANERGVAWWENLASGWLGLGLKAHERVSLDAKIYAMWAAERPFAGAALFGGGDYRGTLSIVKIDWNLEKSLTGHLLWEMLRPGDYYAGGSDAAHFLRWEFMLRY
ncbi:MAG: alginate export family protein, partial [Candidatus Krumholzibacteria bacterium]|nr:alginate export family protein [Candidatus Krumholzibacteria bacterium]